MNNETHYDPRAIEERWQRAWNEIDAFATDRVDGEPFYILEMFPYPSGALHMGHVRVYTIGDVFARFFRMLGRNVLHPMGWDALGLPAENQAIKEKVAPQIRTPQNIAQMKLQMQRLGLAYDWSRELGTYEPEYYRWNQWFFCKFYEKGWVYRRESNVNWCPGCNTVIANEQVKEVDGRLECWRGHAGVTTRSIPEWAFRITDFAEELLADLDDLKEWPERIVNQQRHWIGKSSGANLRFDVVDHDAAIDVFTTRVDTIFGCTYVVLAPEHPLTLQITKEPQRAEVEAFVAAQRSTDKLQRTALDAPKLGVFTGAMARNPYNGEPVPVWIANFVLAEYGTGAVMSVPAHDQRDFEFARKYGLPIVEVIQPQNGSLDEPLTAAFTEDGILAASGQFDGLDSETARTKMTTFAEEQGFGQGAVSWHLRDWGFSRQRYWGTPIPIIYCEEHGAVTVPLAELPVELPDFDAVELTGEGGAPLGKLPSFYQADCPVCGKPGTRETDTMDTFVDSAWYFARYLTPRFAKGPFDPAVAARWLPVDVYVGGPEHAVMHLLYFRFWTKAMQKLGLVEVTEPTERLLTQGMVNAAAYHCKKHGYVPAVDLRGKSGAELVCPTCGDALVTAVVKMSKSKYNGIDPMELIDRYGADTARLYTLFAAPPENDLEWSFEGVEGIARFVARVFRLCQAQAARVRDAEVCRSMDGLAGADAEVRRAVHRTYKKAAEEFGQRNHFNTVIAALMELCNKLHEHKLHVADSAALSRGVVREALLLLAQMLAPLAPHLAEEIWASAGGEGLVCHSRWLEPDPEAVALETLTIAVQVNGKLRGQIEIAPGTAKEQVLAAAKAEPKVQKHLAGKGVKKEIYVPNRLVNLVVG